MGNTKLAQLEQLSQQLIFQIKTLDHLMAHTWLELELTHHMVKSLTQTYNEFTEEEQCFH